MISFWLPPRAKITRVTLDGRKVAAQENLIEGNVGRIREMSEGPDGYIYFSTSKSRRPGNSRQGR
ncbi:MAG: PQQ-dependent sugar dehydrogenase [Chloracidobacterium sp.]|nr:PQQ-dependent sugar dehydrogenase [Chloracidobacterium sp.]